MYAFIVDTSTCEYHLLIIKKYIYYAIYTFKITDELILLNLVFIL